MSGDRGGERSADNSEKARIVQEVAGAVTPHTLPTELVSVKHGYPIGEVVVLLSTLGQVYTATGVRTVRLEGLARTGAIFGHGQWLGHFSGGGVFFRCALPGIEEVFWASGLLLSNEDHQQWHMVFTYITDEEAGKILRYIATQQAAGNLWTPPRRELPPPPPEKEPVVI